LLEEAAVAAAEDEDADERLAGDTEREEPLSESELSVDDAERERLRLRTDLCDLLCLRSDLMLLFFFLLSFFRSFLLLLLSLLCLWLFVPLPLLDFFASLRARLRSRESSLSESLPLELESCRPMVEAGWRCCCRGCCC
jgi:hypothetical protein